MARPAPSSFSFERLRVNPPGGALIEFLGFVVGDNLAVGDTVVVADAPPAGHAPDGRKRWAGSIAAKLSDRKFIVDVIWAPLSDEAARPAKGADPKGKSKPAAEPRDDGGHRVFATASKLTMTVTNPGGEEDTTAPQTVDVDVVP